MSRLSFAERPAPASAARSTIEVLVEGRTWTRSLPHAAAISRRAALMALAATGPKRPVEISILLANDGAVRKLNATYRNQDKATNVLSFPAFPDARSRAQAARRLPRGVAPALGDIAVAFGVLARESRTEHKTLKAHLSHLVVHGVLHLLGYDHEHDADAATMERLEKKILARLGITDPYALAPAERRRLPKKRRAGR